jgi:hypothetical protein
MRKTIFLIAREEAIFLIHSLTRKNIQEEIIFLLSAFRSGGIERAPNAFSASIMLLGERERAVLRSIPFLDRNMCNPDWIYFIIDN